MPPSPSPPPTSFLPLGTSPTDLSSIFTGTTSSPFAASSSAGPDGTSSTDENDGKNNDFAKNTLQYVLLSLAIFLIGCIMFKRYLRLQQSNQPVTRFFDPRATTTTRTPFGANTSFGTSPTDIPRSYQPDSRRVRGEAIGSGGQRLDTAVHEDHPLGIQDSEKDVLPAYSKLGGPPQYVEADPQQGPQAAGSASPPPPQASAPSEAAERRPE